MSKTGPPEPIMPYVCNLSYIILVQPNSLIVVKKFIGTWVWKKKTAS